MNELESLSRLRAGTPEPSPSQLLAGRERLLSATAADTPKVRQYGRRVARRQRARGWALSAAALAAAIGVVAITGGPWTMRRQLPQVDLVARILRTAALSAASQPGSEPASGQWIYTRTLDYEEGRGTATNDNWITFDGGRTAYYQGRTLIVSHSPVAPAHGGGLAAFAADATPLSAYEALATLPATPDAILSAVDQQIAADQGAIAGAGESPNPHASKPQLEFQLLTNLLWNAAKAAPAQAEANVFRTLATIPGVAVTPGIDDAAGRPSVAVSDAGDSQQLLLDAHTYQINGLRTVSNGTWPVDPTQPNSARYPAGTVISSLAWAQISFVRGPGVN